MLTKIKNFFSPLTVHETAALDLEDARKEMFKAQAHQEMWVHQIKYQEARIARLSLMLGQGAHPSLVPAVRKAVAA